MLNRVASRASQTSPHCHKFQNMRTKVRERKTKRKKPKKQKTCLAVAAAAPTEIGRPNKAPVRWKRTGKRIMQNQQKLFVRTMVQFDILINVFQFISTSDVFALKFACKDLRKQFKISVVKRVVREMEKREQESREKMRDERERQERAQQESLRWQFLFIFIRTRHHISPMVIHGQPVSFVCSCFASLSFLGFVRACSV
jgi:hypothetical protein